MFKCQKRNIFTGKIDIQLQKALILETENASYHFRTTFAGMNISDGLGVIWAWETANDEVKLYKLSNIFCVNIVSQLRIQQHYLRESAEPYCPIIPLKFQSEQQMEFGQYSWLQKDVGFLLLQEINIYHTFQI